MLIRKHKQFVSLFASLAILLAQFSLVLHATDHPFHQEEALCVSFQSADQSKHSSHSVLSVVVAHNFTVDVLSPLTEVIASVSFTHYSSRAPPVFTV